MTNSKPKQLFIKKTHFKQYYFKSLFILILCGFALPMPLFARDVAMEQFSVTAARKDYETAKTRNEDLSVKISDQEKRVQQEQARLKELQLQQSLATEKLAATKAELEKKQKALERAWDDKSK